jgi:hypothetical protein
MLATAAELKLFCHLCEKMTGREIRTFSSLVDYVRSLNPSFDPAPTLLQCFQQLKEMSWGFLRELSRSEYPKLWKELVLPHPDFPSAGDLKRNISIANIYIAMLDIHGYTRFCQDSKSNLSRLRKLDEFLHEGIRKIARANSCLANRERGDEIVVLAASATDLLKTCLELINTFSKHAVIKDVEHNRSDYSIVLPEFKVTVGAAGGNLTTPLIITESGLVSGFLLNTAARLQNLANELSPRESKVMVTNAVCSNFLKENKIVRSELFSRNLIQFLNIGPMSFKGTKVSCFEVIYTAEEKYRLGWVESLERLFESVRQELWNRKVLENLLELVVQVAAKSPSFTIPAASAVPLPSKLPGNITNASIIQLCQRIGQEYKADEFLSALALLGDLQHDLEKVPEFDRLTLRYLSGIREKYTLVAEEYQKRLQDEVREKASVIFPPGLRKAWEKYPETLDKLKDYAMHSKHIANRRGSWNALVEEKKEELSLEIYIGKR